MKFISIILSVCITMLTISYTVLGEEYYSEDYRDKLIALYECLDKQMSEYELTDNTRVQFNTGGIKVAVRNSEPDDAVLWNDARKVMAMLCGEHPRFLSTVNNIGYYINQSDPEYVSSIDMKRLNIDGTYEDVYNEIEKRADDIINEIIKDGMSELDKVYAVYMYLMKNCESLSTSGTNDRSPDTVYGVLMENRGSCGGFANTFKLFMDRLGIGSEICNSRSKGHIWNYVKVDGCWYHIDASAGALNSSAEYFLVSEDERQQQLISEENDVVCDWESIYANVNCTSHKFDHGYVFDNFSGNTLKSIEYNNGRYTFIYNGEQFCSASLYIVNNIISVPRSNITGEIAGISDMGSAYSVIYGSKRDFEAYIVCVDAGGKILKSEKRRIIFDSDNRRINWSIDAPDGTNEIKIYSWNEDMRPVANVTKVTDI